MVPGCKDSIVLSSLGWVDRGCLRVFNSRADEDRKIELSRTASYLTLHSQDFDYFSVGHHFERGHFEVTVHRFTNPEEVLAHSIIGRKSTTSGDATLWNHVPRLYVADLGEPWRDWVLVTVGTDGIANVHELEWYNSYDKLYQAPVDVVQVSPTTALVSVQRSSTLVFHDLVSGHRDGTLELAGRGGNPKLVLREQGNELWTIDYDTVVVIDTARRQVKSSRNVQPEAGNVRRFAGDLAFSCDGESCVVARPFSGDVLELDPSTLEVRAAATVNAQPIEAALIAPGQVIARDWKTGKPLRASLQRNGNSGDGGDN